MSSFKNNVSLSRLAYSFLMFGGMGLGFAKWIIFAKVIQPAEFGVYAAVITSTAFVSLFGLFGLNEYLLKEGSALLGVGRLKNVAGLRDQILIVGVFNSLIIIALVLALCWIISFDYFSLIDYLFISLLILINVAYNIVDASLRAATQFLVFAGMIFLRAVLLVCLGLAFAPTHGVTGILFAEVISGLFAMVFGVRTMPFRIQHIPGPLRLSTVFAFLSKGRVFLGLQTSRYFSLTVDKWMVGWFAGAVALGHYSFVLITFVGFMAVAGLFNAVLIPKLIAKFGSDGNIFALRRYIIRLCSYFFAISILVAPFYMVFISLVIPVIFKRYAFDGMVPALAFIYIGSVLHVAHHFFDGYFYSQSKQRELSLINAVSLFIFLFFFLIAGFAGGDIIYFGIAFMLSKSFLFGVVFWFFFAGKIIKFLDRKL